MVRDLIPKKVAMPKEMVDLIANNLERASTPNSIIRFAFWTPDQYNFNTFCENNKRVIFTSSPSTGKTILMMNSALKLLKEGQRVLFLSGPSLMVGPVGPWPHHFFEGGKN